MKSNILLKHSNYAAFSRFHGCSVNNLGEILYFSSQNKKVHLVLKDGQKEFNGKLKEIAKKIPGNFIQIHQSYLINFDYIEECSYESVNMKNGDTIPISQPYRKSVRKQLAERVWRDRE